MHHRLLVHVDELFNKGKIFFNELYKVLGLPKGGSSVQEAHIVSVARVASVFESVSLLLEVLDVCVVHKEFI